MNARSRFIASVLVIDITIPPVAAQENARGEWRAMNDCFIQAFLLGDRGMASVRYSSGADERGSRWTWGKEGLNIVSDTRGVLLMAGHYEDTVLVADVDYSTTDDVDFRTCRFTR
jgi:hypothetical protein